MTDTKAIEAAEAWATEELKQLTDEDAISRIDIGLYKMWAETGFLAGVEFMRGEREKAIRLAVEMVREHNWYRKDEIVAAVLKEVG